MVTIKLQTPDVTVGRYIGVEGIRRAFMAGDRVTLPAPKPEVPYGYPTVFEGTTRARTDGPAIEPGQVALVFLPDGRVVEVERAQDGSTTSVQVVADVTGVVGAP